MAGMWGMWIVPCFCPFQQLHFLLGVGFWHFWWILYGCCSSNCQEHRFWCVGMSTSSFTTVIQIEIVVRLLSWKIQIKGNNTLKQENKIKEQEKGKKKSSFARRKWQSLRTEKNQVMYFGELSKVFGIPSHNPWNWRDMVWITLLYRNVEFLGKAPVEKAWVVHWDWQDLWNGA